MLAEHFLHIKREFWTQTWRWAFPIDRKNCLFHFYFYFSKVLCVLNYRWDHCMPFFFFWFWKKFLLHWESLRSGSADGGDYGDQQRRSLTRVHRAPSTLKGALKQEGMKGYQDGWGRRRTWWRQMQWAAWWLAPVCSVNIQGQTQERQTKRGQ